MKSRLHKITRKKINAKFSRKNIRYHIPENGAFILKPDPIYYGKLKIESKVDLLD